MARLASLVGGSRRMRQ